IWYHPPFLKRFPQIATISLGALLLVSILSVNSIELWRAKPVPVEQLLEIEDGHMTSTTLIPNTESSSNVVEFHSLTSISVHEGCSKETRYRVAHSEGAFIFPERGIVQHY